MIQIADSICIHSYEISVVVLKVLILSPTLLKFITFLLLLRTKTWLNRSMSKFAKYCQNSQPIKQYWINFDKHFFEQFIPIYLYL